MIIKSGFNVPIFHTRYRRTGWSGKVSLAGEIWAYLFGASKHEHSQLAVHFLSFQDCLEFLQILHHNRISLEVREMVVNLKMKFTLLKTIVLRPGNKKLETRKSTNPSLKLLWRVSAFRKRRHENKWRGQGFCNKVNLRAEYYKNIKIVWHHLWTTP